jgi:hypothetical protein
MEQVSSRDVLQDLAEQPIGSAKLQAEADRIAHAKGAVRPTGELKETIKRTAKLWLPQGKRPARSRTACNEPEAQQTDIEDAVEAAGEKRGGQPA